jgi:hypothetical protein
MAEESKNEIKTITPAKVQQRSVAKDLAKYAMDEYIRPKTNDVLHDLFAGVVDMFGDAVRGAIDKQFYGEDRNRNRAKNPQVRTFNQNVPYNVYSLSPSSSFQQKPQRVNNSQRSGKSVKLIYLNTEDEAKYVVNMLKEEIATYGNVKVGKLYETIKEPTSPEDWKFGWNDQADIGYTRDHGSFLLTLAEPINVLNQ